MSSNQDVYRKVGRGGAGNFYSNPVAKDDSNKDREAQYPDPSALPSIPSSTPSSSTTNAYARAGRGGAGNFVESTAAKQQQRVEESVTASAVGSAAAGAGGGASRMALGGRGGAGNYHQKVQEDAEKEEERKRIEEMEKKAVEAVDEGLQMPPKAKLASGDRA